MFPFPTSAFIILDFELQLNNLQILLTSLGTMQKKNMTFQLLTIKLNFLTNGPIGQEY